MIEPTERLLWSVAVVVVVGALGLAVPVIGVAAPFALVGLLLCVVADVVLAGSPRALLISRVVPERLIERRVVDVGVVVQAPRRLRVPVQVEVTDTLPEVVDPWLSFSTRLSAGESVTMTAPRVFLKRGRHRPGRLAVRTLGPLGLVRRRQRRLLDDEFAVSADLSVVMERAVRLVQGRDSEGGRRKRAVERGRDFDSMREYRRGDDVRLVDWKATARKGSLVVKELVPETRQDVVVIVDGGRQLCGRNDDVVAGEATGVGSDRFEVAVTTALVLCAAALMKGDRCGIGVLQDDVVAWEPPRSGKSMLKRTADATADVTALPLESAYHLLPGFLSARLKRRALLCVITDVVDEASGRALAHALLGLRGRHLVVVLALADPGLSRLARAPVDGADPLGRSMPLAAQRLVQHRKRGLAALEAAGAVVVDAPAPRAAALAVDAYLALKSAGRL